MFVKFQQSWIFVLVVFVACQLTTLPVSAQSTYWTGGPAGSWNAGTWSNGTPGISHNGIDYFYGTGGAYSLSLSSNLSIPFSRLEVLGNNVVLDLNGFVVNTQPYQYLNSLPITTLVGWSGTSQQSKLTVMDGTWNNINGGRIQIGYPNGSSAAAEFSVGADGIVTAAQVGGYSSSLDTLSVESRGSINISSSLSNVTVRMNSGALYLPSSVSNVSYAGSRSGVVIGNSNSPTFSASAVADDLPSFTVATGKYAYIHSFGQATLGLNTYLLGGQIIAPSGGVRLASGRVVSGSGVINAAFSGDAGSSIEVMPGSSPLTIGAAVNGGFKTRGNIYFVGNQLNLISNDRALLGGYNLLNGGTMTAANGVTLDAGGTIDGSGIVDAKFSGNGGSLISAEAGNLTVGKAVNGGFFHLGELRTGDQTVTLLNNTRSTLGSSTTLGNGSTGGTLIVANGAYLDFGRLIVGQGVVDSTNTLSKAMIINGDVIGDSVTNQITFNGYVKGVGTFENVIMNGTFSPGLSPTISNVNNLTMGTSSILDMEIGGLVAGSQFDKLFDAGNLTLDGTLKVTLINGFNPVLGNSFDLLDWSSLLGSFSSFDFSLANLGPGLAWDTSQVYSNGSISVVAIPEPTALLLVSITTISLLPRRKRRTVA